ncbi:MAG: glycosyltransferase family 39 protein [Micrococcales bacterium]|nr:glycosyltransferase family 39 protein [Micrococcales bacterium]
MTFVIGRMRLRLEIWLGTTAAGRFVQRWGAPIAITLFAAAQRLIHLGQPHKLIFDETYYVKEGYSMLVSGYERQWAPGEESEAGNTTNLGFEEGKTGLLLEEPEYVVHPPAGKWMIALGMRLFGWQSSFGWRFSSAVVGTLAVFVLIVTARRLFNSHILGCVAGLLFAVDGQLIVHSRIGLLDPFLMFWALLAFYLVLVDRAQYQKRLTQILERPAGYNANGRPLAPSLEWGPRTGFRPWLVAVGVALGLATGVKWSGLYFAAAYGVLVVAWDCADRRAAGIRQWWLAGGLLDGVKAFFLIIPTMALTYLATWAGWFASKDGYFRHWAETEDGGSMTSGIMASLKSLAHYHKEAWNFHTSLTSEHSYEENALSWLIQRRPTSFSWGVEETCGGKSCAQAITSLGNPVIWWVGVIGLLAVLYFAVMWADRRAWAIFVGYAGGYLPWFLYLHRTVFTFYTIAFAPFVVLALTYLLGVMLGPPGASPVRRRRGAIAAGTIITLAVAMCAFFWPLWTGESITYNYWRAHMWFSSWI